MSDGKSRRDERKLKDLRERRLRWDIRRIVLATLLILVTIGIRVSGVL